ncbi:hypothetical protein [Bacillus sp. TE9122W]
MPYEEVYVEPEVFMEYNENQKIYHVYVNDNIDFPLHYYYSFENEDCPDCFDVRELPLYKEEYKNCFQCKEDYFKLLIVASIANGHLDEYLGNPYHLVHDFTIYKSDSIEKSIEVIVKHQEGEDYWNWDYTMSDRSENIQSIEVFFHGSYKIGLPVKNVREIRAFIDILLDLNSLSFEEEKH